MTIEEEVFEEASYEEIKLLKYGFQKQNDQFCYETTIYNQEFQVIITITKDGIVFGKMIEIDSNEEFFSFRLNNVEGTFANQVRAEYIKLLTDIKKNCFKFIPRVTAWVVPANTKRYDVIAHFKEYETITWRWSVNIELHDIVYIYIGSPISAIMFQCEATNMKEHQNTMELKLLETYEATKYPLKKLRNFGLKAIRGTRKMPQKTIDFLKEDSL